MTINEREKNKLCYKKPDVSKFNEAYFEPSIGLPVGRIDLADTSDEQFEFPLVERAEQV